MLRKQTALSKRWLSEMDENLFWDKKISIEAVKKILSDDTHLRFIEFAALLLSRTNDAKAVFGSYLGKVEFCKNWRQIKSRMRKNRWADERIIFWDEVYKVVKKKVRLRIPKRKPKLLTSETKRIGDIIKEARKAKGWTQKGLAEKAGVSQQLVSFVERGYSSFSFKTLKKITTVLGLMIAITSPGSPSSRTDGGITGTSTYAD